MPNLTFITTTGPKLDNNDRKVVKGYTTRVNFTRRRQKRAAVDSACLHSKPHQMILESQQSDTPEEQSTSITLSNASSSPTPPLWSNTMVDENTFFIGYLFDSSRPILFQDDTVDALVNNFKESDWLELISSEQALLEATLYLAANLYAKRNWSKSDVSAVNFHKGQAIRIINERLNSPSTSLSDGIISAVFTLAMSDRVAGDYYSSRVHMNGLEQMLQIRFTTPQYQPAPWLTNLLLSTAVSNAAISHNLYRQKDFTTAADSFNGAPNDVTTAAMVTISNIAKAVSRMQSCNTLDQNAALNYFILEIEELLIAQSGLQFPHELSSVNCILIASKIFLERLVHYPDEAAYEEEQAIRLMDALKAPSVHLCSSLDVAFWLFMMGAILHSELETHDWYITMLRKVSHAQHLMTWEEALDILRKFFWVEHIFWSPCYSVWLELTGYQSQ
ncbi:hypothetical protein F5884DRAFT_782478 [Xylogone sp. PMI_703]|nr:hypothetical protein F5884DRAFT_782478 [Xylogone sp. PMI_703]